LFKNVFYDNKRSRMYLWEQKNGVNDYTIVDWVPYVYEENPNGIIKTIEGIPVQQKKFGTFKDYSDYQKYHADTIYENEVPKDVQFLTEKYHPIADADIEVPKLKIYSLDIEVQSEKGFPHANTAEHPISLINIREFGGGHNITWGFKPYTGDNEENIEYIQCLDEAQMLQKYFDWWHNNAPDVVTGWNICPNNKMNKRGGFDFPYIVNRSKNLFGPKSVLYKKLSPISVVRCWEDSESGALNLDIAGVSLLDYYALYKWYSPKNPENYKLDTICREELKLGKLDYSEYTDLKTLYHENFNLYVDYNAVDDKRIEELEDKLGYIRLAQNLALLCRTKMENYMAATPLVEGLMMTHYRRNGLCAPRLEGGNQTWFPAAFVKEPRRGQYDWVVDLDIASSYPTAIITLNMSPETYYGRLIAYEDEHGRMIDMINGRDEIDIEEVAKLETPITEYIRKRKLPRFKLMKDTGVTTIEGVKLDKFNMALEKGLICVSPCGSMFMQTKRGHFSQVEQETYKKRSDIKNLMKEARAKASRARNPENKREHEIRAANLYALQWALKIVLNSAYGVTGVPYSRYFNVNISEAITSCGRRSIIDGQKFVNRWFKDGHWLTDETITELSRLGDVDTSKVVDNDQVAYIDTDSVFITLGNFLDQVITNPDGDWKKVLPEETIIDVILKVSKIVETYINDCAYEETQLQGYNARMAKDDFAITFKQEIVCKSALFIQKKKYGYHVVNDEGDPCDKIDVTGLEIIRSETPSVFREALREMLGMVLRNEDDDVILETYKKHKKLAKASYPEEISENKGVKGLSKYIVDGEPIKGTPYHVRAVAMYHRLLSELELEDTYPKIEEDTKNKLVYVKPNPYRINCIMYDRWPKEFNIAGVEPDYEKMIDKFLHQKMLMLLEPAGKTHILSQNQAFKAFFG